MIEGIKPVVSSEKLKELCLERAAHHEARVKVYSEQLGNFNAAKIEAADFTGGDPTRALESKKAQHEDERNLLLFMAYNLKAGEEYVLSGEDLRLLGIRKDRY